MRYSRLIIPVVLILAAGGIYAQTAGFSFVGFDDPQLILNNPHVATGLTPGSIQWALMSAWHEHVFFYPLAMISHMAAVSVFGLNPAGHHLANAGLHVLAVLLVFYCLCRWTGSVWRPAMAAMLVAVHPMNVDSVAWVAQRSTVLCAVFWMAGLWGYIRFARQETRKWFWFAFGMFVLAVLAKSAAVTVPLLLLLIDGSMGRMATKHPWPVIREKLPYFAVAGLWSLMVMATADQSGAATTIADVSAWMRMANALTACGVYLIRMVWPAGLAVYYPFPDQIPLWQPVLSGMVVLAITILLLRHARRMPMVLIGWLWYLVTLVPMLGFVQAGPWPATADHYMYMPGIGLFICLAWSIPDMQKRGPVQKGVAGAIIAGVLLTLAIASWHHAGHYKNSIALFERAVRVTQHNFFARINLGSAYARNGDLAKAADQFDAALALRPDSPGALTNRANIEKKAGRIEQAMAYYISALDHAPGFAPAHTGLADLLAMTGDIDKAIDHYRRAIAIDRTAVAARYNLGMVLASRNQLIEAYYQVRKALDNATRNPDIHCGFAEIALALGRHEEAERHFNKALALDASSKRAQNGLSRVLEFQ